MSDDRKPPLDVGPEKALLPLPVISSSWILLLSLVFRMLIGGVLIYAGFMKAIRPTAEFAAVLSAYQIVPPWAIPHLALAVPYLEMWIGLFVFLGLYARLAPLAACGIFSVFVVVLTAALARGIDLASCGCFGPGVLSPRKTLLLDIVLLLMSFWLYRINKYPQSLTLDDLLS